MAVNITTQNGSDPPLQIDKKLRNEFSRLKIYPKRIFDQEEINDNQLIAHFGEKYESARVGLDSLLAYVTSSYIIYDSFSDDEERKAWRVKMYEEFGDIFRITYDEINQLRANRITGVLLRMQIMEKYVRNREVERYIYLIRSHLFGYFQSPSETSDSETIYKKMSLKNKIRVARKVEEGSLIVLRILNEPGLVRDKKWQKSINNWLNNNITSSRTNYINKNGILYKVLRVNKPPRIWE